jgi:sugar phosphate isomerase/epimerase
VRRKLADAAVRVSAIGSPIGKIGVHDDFKPHFETFKRVVETAQTLSCRYIRMFSFYIPTDENPADCRGEVMSRLHKLSEYAKSQDVVLLHENEKGIYGNNAERCLDIMKELYSDHFGCTFDFANFVQCDQDTMEAYEMLRSYINYVHVKDAVFADGHVVLPGTGDGRLADIFRLLERDGYSGFFSMEPHLTDFNGFRALERSDDKKAASPKAETAQGESAFTAAYLCARGLLSR